MSNAALLTNPLPLSEMEAVANALDEPFELDGDANVNNGRLANRVTPDVQVLGQVTNPVPVAKKANVESSSSKTKANIGDKSKVV